MSTKLLGIAIFAAGLGAIVYEVDAAQPARKTALHWWCWDIAAGIFAWQLSKWFFSLPFRHCFARCPERSIVRAAVRNGALWGAALSRAMPLVISFAVALAVMHFGLARAKQICCIEDAVVQNRLKNTTTVLTVLLMGAVLWAMKNAAMATMLLQLAMETHEHRVRQLADMRIAMSLLTVPVALPTVHRQTSASTLASVSETPPVVPAAAAAMPGAEQKSVGSTTAKVDFPTMGRTIGAALRKHSLIPWLPHGGKGRKAASAVTAAELINAAEGGALLPPPAAVYPMQTTKSMLARMCGCGRPKPGEAGSDAMPRESVPATQHEKLIMFQELSVWVTQTQLCLWRSGDRQFVSPLTDKSRTRLASQAFHRLAAAQRHHGGDRTTLSEGGPTADSMQGMSSTVAAVEQREPAAASGGSESDNEDTVSRAASSLGPQAHDSGGMDKSNDVGNPRPRANTGPQAEEEQVSYETLQVALQNAVNALGGSRLLHTKLAGRYHFDVERLSSDVISSMDSRGVGHISLNEFVGAVHELASSWKAARADLNGQRGAATSAAGILANIVWLIATVAFSVLLLGVDLTPALLPLGTAALATSFAIGPSIQQVLASLILVLVQRPFNAGDPVLIKSIGPDPVIVDRVEIMSTTFKSRMGTTMTVANDKLRAEIIENYRQVRPARVRATCQLIPNVAEDQLKAVHAEVREYLATRPGEFHPAAVFVYNILPHGVLEMMCVARHTQGWVTAAREMSRAGLAFALHNAAAKQGILYYAPVLALPM